jgi:hypothetical protein
MNSGLKSLKIDCNEPILHCIDMNTCKINNITDYFNEYLDNIKK